ncbi:MAG: hypothetical protein Q9207_000262 [Kuettlingeria erythrocarpa]
MASSIPTALKSADIARFAQRAGQLEKAKPAIAYWCNYWVVNQLISRGLHNVDEECTSYTTELMDKLERLKMEHGDDDTITDDVAAQVYVEQFALETFQRAENAMRANKASRQTADTLLAAAVFLELRQIWESLDPETSSKIRFAKYHALRIAKAIRAGEDPNATNPAAEPDIGPGSPLNTNGVGASPVGETSTAAFQPVVEDVSDDRDSRRRHKVQDTLVDQPPYPSRPQFASSQWDEAATTPPQIAPRVEGSANYYRRPSVPDVSPLQSPERARNSSIGGGYFPRAPDAQEQGAMTQGPPCDVPFSSFPGLPDTSDLSEPNTNLLPDPPDHSSGRFRSFTPSTMDQNFDPSSSSPAIPLGPQQYRVASTQSPGYPQPSAPGMSQPVSTSAHQLTPLPMPPPVQQPYTPAVVLDEETIAKAQKHARWAISALNFEDVNTAIKELRGALESLGAT